MKAWVLKQPAPAELRPLELTDLPTPRPGPGEVLIRVSACGVCRTDLHVVEGDLPVRRSPVIPGHQIVGSVEQIGDGVSGIDKGRRVGLAWLNSTCGKCPFCTTGRENLCETAEFTG